MSSPFRTPEFLALFAEWNGILEKSGHKEIEDFSKPDVPFKSGWEAFNLNHLSIEERQARQLYYEKARAALHTYNFKHPIHRLIWEMYSEGVSIRSIAGTIGRKKYRKSNIFNILRKIRKDLE
jgi:hypothetical protein